MDITSKDDFYKAEQKRNNAKCKLQLGAIPEDGFMRLKQVLSVIPEGKTTFYKGIQEGRRPAPVKLSVRTSAWRCEDIRKLVAELGGKS